MASTSLCATSSCAASKQALLLLLLQASFRGLLKEGQLEDRQATFELPASASRVQPFDGMGGLAVHELISG